LGQSDAKRKKKPYENKASERKRTEDLAERITKQNQRKEWEGVEASKNAEEEVNKTITAEARHRAKDNPQELNEMHVNQRNTKPKAVQSLIGLFASPVQNRKATLTPRQFYGKKNTTTKSLETRGQKEAAAQIERENRRKAGANIPITPRSSYA
jgi:hypothetical protein